MTFPLALIGNTPLLRLERVGAGLPTGVEIHAKAEWYNLGSSVKDRPALAMIRDGERRGLLRPGMRIADATSGNTGIAYATIGAALGYAVTLALPANVSVERIRTLRALGVELLLTDASEGVAAALRVARELRDGVVVTILCDSASRYLSERFWEEDGLIAGDGI